MITLLLKVLVPFLFIVHFLLIFIWLERKGAAYIQDRRGPNRTNIAGIRLGGVIQNVADVLKMMFKEDIVPTRANRFLYTLAPFVTMTVAAITFAVIPWAAPLEIAGKVWNVQAADFNVGILYIFAISSLGVYGIMLAGWSSNNKFSLLGGIRSSAQIISYELTMSLSVIGVLILAGSLELGAIVENQGTNLLHWNFLRQPVGCLLFIVAAFAETNRLPFDLPEAEAELVAGYHVEYSSLKFGLFMMSEYVNMTIAAALMVLLFFGGWQLPFVSTTLLRENASSLSYYLAWGFGVASVLLGLYLVFKRHSFKYGDARDYESKVLGVPAVLIGAGVIAAVVFFGRWGLGDLGSQVVAALLQFGVFFLKILFFCWMFVWIRWTLPRFRYDQLMRLGWRFMLPIALVNLVATAGVYLLWF